MYDNNTKKDRRNNLLATYYNRVAEQEKLIDAIQAQCEELEEAIEYRDAIIEALMAALEVAEVI